MYFNWQRVLAGAESSGLLGGNALLRARVWPRASSGYVFEHILIAEEVLGRYLLEGESGHHINGVKDDNRPESLELWTRPQPSGIRVGDAIERARSICDCYVATGPPPTTLTGLTPERSWSCLSLFEPG
jgi:hypothetical protein